MATSCRQAAQAPGNSVFPVSNRFRTASRRVTRAAVSSGLVIGPPLNWEDSTLVRAPAIGLGGWNLPTGRSTQ